MKLVSISIEKLFGQFDYTIELNQKENITILTGPNGYGKTTILNILYSIFNEEFAKIKMFKLERISFLFDNGQTIIFHKEKLPTNDEIILLFEVFLDNKKIETEAFSFNQENPHYHNNYITKNIMEIIKSIPVYFIKDQRLIKNSFPKNDGTFTPNGSIKEGVQPVFAATTITVYAAELCMDIFKIQTEEKKLADELAPSLTKRFKDYKTTLPTSEYQERFQKLSEKYKRLQEYGIYQNDLESTEYEGDDRRFFSLNLEDWEKKTAVYDDLLEKLNLFVALLNDKGLTNKKAAIKADKGFVFTTLDGQILELLELSSGEQNEVILLYELLFRAEPDSLVLIDEPETSMHVAWQYEFIPDLKKIVALKPLSFLIATHSPDIINDQDSIDLYELIHGESEDDDE
jgi:predicted ATP-binding protein involved in virulence